MHSLRSLLALTSGLTLATAASSPGGIAVRFAPSPPPNAYTVSPSFLAFTFDEQTIVDYAGNSSHPNTFSQNLIQNLNNRTGVPAPIRIAGTWGDRVTYNASQTDLPLVYTDQLAWSVGPSFFDSYKQFPGSKITIQTKLGPVEDLNNSVAFAQQAFKAVGPENFDALEIGNEVNFYPNYTVEKYVSDFLRFEQALEEGIPGLPKGPIYEGCDSAPGQVPSQEWQPEAELRAGLNNNTRIKAMAVHYYQVSHVADSLQDLLMDHGAIVNGFQNYTPSIGYTRQQKLPYILSEVGNSLENPTNTTFQAVLGSALWSVDFQLHVMTLGVERVNMALTSLNSFSPWIGTQNDVLPPVVYPTYYAQVFIADFLGNGKPIKVVNHDLNSNRLTAYAAYEQGKVARIALVNLNLWDGPDPSLRPTQNFSIPVDPQKKSVEVRRLTAPTGAYASTTITWAGVQWTYDSRGMGVIVNPEQTEAVPVQNGTAVVEVADSEAVMVVL